MTPDEKETLRSQIVKELAECDSTVERLIEASAAVSPDKSIGRLTRMEMIGDLNVSKAKLSQLQERRYKLKVALQKIDQPGFGICVKCKQTIPMERLLAIPESVMCVPCLQKLRK